MFKNMSLKGKMLGAFTFVGALPVIMGAVTYYQVGKTVSLYINITTDNIPNLQAFNDMQVAQKDIEIAVTDLSGENPGKQAVEKSKNAIENAIKHFESAEKVYESFPFEAGEEERWTTFKKEQWLPFLDMSKKILELAQRDQKEAFQALNEIYSKLFVPKMDSIGKSFDDLNKFQTDSVLRNSKDAVSSTNRMYVVMWLLVAIGFAVAQAISIFFSNSLSKSMMGTTESLSGGATELDLASKQLAETSQALSASVTQQAAAIQETASSIDEVSAMVNKNAENAKQSQETSTLSRDAATKGKEVVGEMLRSIGEINQSNNEIMQQIENSNREISEIVKVISEIGSKTKIINDIVFQTKLLSFNASVEAARAGEHGKGFAVVAEEVGNLAQMSGNAAKEISQMLEGSIQKVERIVSETQSKIEHLVRTGKEKVQAGSATAKHCDEVLDEIVENVNKVDQMMAEISSASQEQAQGVQEITKAMGQLDQATQQNSVASQQAAGAVSQLADQAKALRNVVTGLDRTVRGSKAVAERSLDSVSSPAQPAAKAKARKAKLSVVKTNEESGSEEAREESKDTGRPKKDDPRFEVA